MDSISELALKGHFENLKEDANRKNLNDQPLVMLMKALAYLEKVNNRGLLDDEGKELIDHLRGYSSSETDFLKPKPMARAKGKASVEKKTTKKVG